MSQKKTWTMIVPDHFVIE